MFLWVVYTVPRISVVFLYPTEVRSTEHGVLRLVLKDKSYNKALIQAGQAVQKGDSTSRGLGVCAKYGVTRTPLTPNFAQESELHAVLLQASWAVSGTELGVFRTSWPIGFTWRVGSMEVS